MLGAAFGEMDEYGRIVDVKPAEMIATWNRFGRQERQSVEGERFIGFENHLFAGEGVLG